jgi:hypothetical protein
MSQLLDYYKDSCSHSLGDRADFCLQTMIPLEENLLFDCLEGFIVSFIAKVLINSRRPKYDCDSRRPESGCYLPKLNLFCPNSRQVSRFSTNVLTLKPFLRLLFRFSGVAFCEFTVIVVLLLHFRPTLSK